MSTTNIGDPDGHYLNRDGSGYTAYDENNTGVIPVHPNEGAQRFWVPPPSMTDQTYQDTAEEVAGAIAKQSDLEATKEDLIQLQQVQAAARATLQWVSPDIQDMAAFPWLLMAPTPRLSIGQTGPVWDSVSALVTTTTGSGDHSHPFDGGNSFDTTGSADGRDGPHYHSYSSRVMGTTGSSGNHSHNIVYDTPSFAVEDQTIEFSVIVADRIAYLDQLKFVTGAGGSTWWGRTLESMRVGLYVLDPMDGKLKAFYLSGELRDSISQSETMVALDLRDRQTGVGPACTPGQVLFAAVWQKGGSGILWTKYPPRPVGGVILPRIAGVASLTRSWLKTGAFTYKSTAGLPREVEYSALTPNFNRQMWAACATG